MQEHELRQALNDELHGRPGLPVNAPARITHMAFTLEAGDAEPLSAMRQLCEALGVKAPAEGALHHGVNIAGGLIKYERHGEFYRISVVADGLAGAAEAISLLPVGWMDRLPGKRLVAIHTHVLPKGAESPSARKLTELFGGDEMACSQTNQGKAMVWTAFRIGDDGYTRMLIHDLGLSPERLGRLTRRLHEIETYRMMALLAVPMARAMNSELGPFEKSLAACVDAMAGERGPEDEGRLLNQLSHIARGVEDLSNRSNFRFSAARAYAALVEKRLVELGEERVLNFQRLGIFLDRRFNPAMSTVTAVNARISALAARCERASNLLRTRVDIALENQNQLLLRSMERRARQQLMLQETVEGLSIAAISYYVIGIVTKLIESLAPFAPWLNVKLATLAAIPIVLCLVWLGLQRLRRRLHAAAQ